MAEAAREPGGVRAMATAMVVTALGTLALIGAATAYAVQTVAERTALTEATRAARIVGDVVFRPALPDLLDGDQAVRTRLDAAVDARRQESGVVRVKVWNRQGVIVYSNEPSATGRSFAARGEVREVIEQGASRAGLSDLSGPENITELPFGPRLVEVYVPLELDSGERLALEMYSTDASMTAAWAELARVLVPFVFLPLLLVLAARFPLSVHLLRRVSRGDAERGRLLSRAHTASQRERRAIARDLHDGVVQDLAGAGYALAAVRSRLDGHGDAAARELLDKSAQAVRDSVRTLRTMMAGLYPPDLTGEGLSHAVERLAERLRAQGIAVATSVDVRAVPDGDRAALVYQAAQECVTNILKHAGARSAWIDVSADARTVVLRVADDGKGPGGAGPEQAGGGGHLGLRLLRDTARELGGCTTVAERQGGGTEVRTVLPVRG